MRAFKLNRLALGVLGALSISAPIAHAALPNGVAAGDVAQNSVVLWARSDNAGAVNFEVATDALFSNIVYTGGSTVADPLAPVKLSVSGLSANTSYYYRATDSVLASAVGQFNTAAALGSHSGLRFGVTGDWRGELASYPAVKNVPGRGLDFFVALGDTIYGDVATPAVPTAQATTLEDFQLRHNEVYSAHAGLNSLVDVRQSTAIFAIIDDHEVTNDFAGGAPTSSDPRFSAGPAGLINDSTLFNNGVQAFEQYNPIAHETYADTGSNPRMDGETKLYRSRQFGSDAKLLMLDARSFRDTELADVANPTDPTQIGNFLGTSLLAPRTMLGNRQMADLKTDLMSAQQSGTTWKFIALPEPIQNLGVLGAADRYEGYAFERTELLKFIADNNITNTVFMSADIHGNLVNNLSYQTLGAGGIVQNPTSAWEITTGSVAYDKPFGPTVLDLAAGVPVAPGLNLQQAFLAQVGAQVGIPGLTLQQFLTLLPRAVQDAALTNLVNQQITPLGYSPVGLQDSGLNVQLLQGGYANLFSYGWTEFDIDAATQLLTVTTYGINPYNAADVLADPTGIAGRTPTVISKFQVAPVPLPAAVWLLAPALGALVGRRRKA